MSTIHVHESGTGYHLFAKNAYQQVFYRSFFDFYHYIMFLCLILLQPEMSIRYYRRLLQMGVNNTELWNNIGLCCFYSSQYDMSLSCFDRALSMASDDDMADVW